MGLGPSLHPAGVRQSGSAMSIKPSPSSSRPLEHAVMPKSGDSELSLGEVHPRSAMSMKPSPSLSLPSLHWGGVAGRAGAGAGEGEREGRFGRHRRSWGRG